MTDFVGRRAFLAEVATWLAGDQRCFVLSGGVGSGKSTALRHVARLHPASVAHFCDPTDLSTRSPSTAARGLAEQLARKVDGYVGALTEDRITGVANVTTAYGATVAGVLVQNLTVNASDENTWLQAVRRPLEQLVHDTGLPAGFFVVVDALDEADRYDGTKLSELIVGFGLDQVRWLLSTRYPTRLVGQLGGSVRQWDFSANHGRQESDDDVRVFLSRHLPRLTTTDQQTAVRRSDGNFLYARLLVDMLAGAAAPAGNINLPNGLDSALHSYLRQIVHGDRDATWLTAYQPVLAALTVIREPVSQPELKRLSGVAHPVLSHVVRRLAPLLAAGDAVTDRVALYHAAFYEFLRDQRRSGEWWCDPAGAQEQLCAAFETQTRQWTDWGRLDRYGVVHLLAHAAQAGWSAREFDQLIVPGYLAQVARLPGTVATVTRHLGPAIRVATTEQDLGRSFTWQWLPHLLRNSLHEMLATDAPVLLIKAGQADLVVEALSSIENDLPSYAGRVVEALAAEGHLEMARATVAVARPSQRPQLLVSAAIGVAATDPALAWSLWQEAVADPTAPSFRYQHRLAMLLATAPDFADRAWGLAGDDRTRRAILVVIAGHDAPLATRMAAQAGLADATSAAWITAAAADPTRTTRLIATHPDWLDERLTAEFLDAQRLGAVGQHYNTAEGLVLLAGALVADPDNADTLAQAEHCAATLNPAMSFFTGDHVALSRLDYTPLRGRPAAAFAVTALTTMIDYCVGTSRSVPERVLGGLCGSLRVLDADAGDAAIERVTTLAGLDRTAIRIEVITRLCPIEPDAAWALTRLPDRDQASRAWVAALPPTLVSVGISMIAGIDPRYSGSRAELAGLLATKLPPGDPATAGQLLELITPTAKSVVFDIERAIVRAACGDTRGAGADMFVRYAADLHDGDVLGVLRFRQRGADVRLSGDDLAAVTDELAARVPDLAIPVLACAAGALARQGDQAGALALLAECLHPDCSPISVHVARWRGIERAVLLAHQELGSLADLVAALLRRPTIGARDGDVVEALALLAVHLGDDERQRLVSLTVRADPDIADVLALVDRICRGEHGVADDIAAVLSGGGPSRGGVLALLVPYALCRTTDAVAALTANASGRRALFEPLPELDEPRFGFLVELLPAIARTQPDAAHRLALGMSEADPSSAAGDDALQAVAVAVAEQNWDRGRRIAETITMADARGLAQAGLAAVAVGLPDKASRRAAYLAILDLPEAGPDWARYRYPLRGLLAALLVDPDPPPDVLVRLIPEVLGMPVAEPLALECLAELTTLLDRSGAGDVIMARIPGLADLVASAWPSWQSMD